MHNFDTNIRNPTSRWIWKKCTNCSFIKFDGNAGIQHQSGANQFDKGNKEAAGENVFDRTGFGNDCQ